MDTAGQQTPRLVVASQKQGQGQKQEQQESVVAAVQAVPGSYPAEQSRHLQLRREVRMAAAVLLLTGRQGVWRRGLRGMQRVQQA